jgi:hypothetical protein
MQLFFICAFRHFPTRRLSWAAIMKKQFQTVFNLIEQKKKENVKYMPLHVLIF